MAERAAAYNIISFGIEQYGLKIGLHSSCNSVRLRTETFQTQQNKVLEVWLTRFDPGVTRSSWIQASMKPRWLRIRIIHGNTRNPPNPLIRSLMAPPRRVYHAEVIHTVSAVVLRFVFVFSEVTTFSEVIFRNNPCSTADQTVSS